MYHVSALEGSWRIGSMYSLHTRVMYSWVSRQIWAAWSNKGCHIVTAVVMAGGTPAAAADAVAAETAPVGPALAAVAASPCKQAPHSFYLVRCALNIIVCPTNLVRCALHMIFCPTNRDWPASPSYVHSVKCCF